MQVTKWLVVEAEKWSSIVELGWFGALVTAVGSLQPPHVSVFQPETYTAGHLANNITVFQNGQRIARDSYSSLLCVSSKTFSSQNRHKWHQNGNNCVFFIWCYVKVFYSAEVMAGGVRPSKYTWREDAVDDSVCWMSLWGTEEGAISLGKLLKMRVCGMWEGAVHSCVDTGVYTSMCVSLHV